jgi:hypothetical protein
MVRLQATRAFDSELIIAKSLKLRLVLDLGGRLDKPMKASLYAHARGGAVQY